jgi:hypothetical protein
LAHRFVEAVDDFRWGYGPAKIIHRRPPRCAIAWPISAQKFLRNPAKAFGKFLKSGIERWKGVVAKYHIRLIYKDRVFSGF